MYTTPRKVKQESRLRRSHSLTSSIAIPNMPSNNTTEQEFTTYLEGSVGLGNPSSSDPTSTFPYKYNCNKTVSGSTSLVVPPTNGSSTGFYSQQPQYQVRNPPPYKLPPNALSTQETSSTLNNPDFGLSDIIVKSKYKDNFQTHSSKFPVVVKEYIIAAESESQSSNCHQEEGNKILRKEPVSSDERKAFTLDSSTGRELQKQLFNHSTGKRRNSLDIEKFIQIFNEEQILMASMQNNSLPHEGGSDNPCFELEQRPPQGYGTKGPTMYFSDSMSTPRHSQSLSLSSSNTDSLDTVIYKIPNQSNGIREWKDQHQANNNRSTLEVISSNVHAEMNNHVSNENNSAREAINQHEVTNNVGTSHQQGMSYHPSMGYSSQINYLNEQQQRQLNNNQVQHSTNHRHMISNGGNHVGNGKSSFGSGTSYHHLSNSQQYQLPQKSPSMQQKAFTPTPTNNTSYDGNSERGSRDPKLFHTKTYNHIKDMISSRFGTPGQVSYNKTETNSGSDQMLSNGNIGIPNSYNSAKQSGSEMNGYNVGNHNHQMISNAVPSIPQPGMSYHPAYQQHQHVSQTINPMISAQLPHHNYGQMNDRKNVNTSFRKAIQHSTQKSNLNEDTFQVRSNTETQHSHFVHQSNGNGIVNPQEFSPKTISNSIGLPSKGTQENLGVHAERAQRALDKLLDVSLMPQNPETFNEQRNTITTAQTHNASTRHGFSIKPTHQQSQHSTKQATSQEHFECTPPPLPTSQKPFASESHQINLPGLSSVRENGDGSSVTAETISKNMISVEKAVLESSNADMSQSRCLSLNGSIEHHSSGSEGEIKGTRVGSGQSHTTTDSGLGTAILLTKPPKHSDSTNEMMDGHNGQISKFSDGLSSGDSEWIDVVEPELRQILEIEKVTKPIKAKNKSDPPTQLGSMNSKTSNLGSSDQNQSTKSSGLTRESGGLESTSNQRHSPAQSPKIPKKFDLNNYNKRASQEIISGPSTSSGQGCSTNSPSKSKSPRIPANILRSNSGSGQRSSWANSNRPQQLSNDKGKSLTVGRKNLLGPNKAGKMTRNAMSQILYSLNDDGDITSTTTGLDLESMLDGPTEATSDDDDLSTTIDTTDAYAIRRQLESLESMYTEVLKVLGGKKYGNGKYPPVTSDLRNAKRRPYGSMSSLPSSVSSRPFRETKKRMEEKKKVKDIKSITRRFQRLESHVVTLARSVAHLSSEMRTQHLMVQEMETIRNELNQLRAQVVKNTIQNQSTAAVAAATAASNGQPIAGRGGRHGRTSPVHNNIHNTDWTSFRNALPSLTNPCRVRKLTQFFGDEPPLIRIFLKKLGYEKYALKFEEERIGIMELPYLTEERLQKMGIPMGPRLRILQEAHMCLKPGAQFTIENPNSNGTTGNLSVYVV